MKMEFVTNTQLTKSVNVISSVDELKDIHGLRPHLFQPFFDTIIRTLNESS